jgi:hypothetical protein
LTCIQKTISASFTSLASKSCSDAIYETTCKKLALDVARGNSDVIPPAFLKIKHLIVALHPHLVVESICSAFEGVRLGRGASLRQMEIQSNYGEDNSGRRLSIGEYDQLKNRDEITDWKAIKLADLEKYDYFSYCDAESFRFYIPARLVECLIEPFRNWSVFYHLYPENKYKGEWEYHMEWYSLLDTRQKHAIASFLWYLLDAPASNYELPRKEIEQALDTYWLQFLDLTDKPR